MGMIATCPSFQKKVLFLAAALFTVALLLGVLISFVLITVPLNETYQKAYQEITKNETVKCFDSTNMTYPILIDSIKVGDYCRANYCSEYQLIGSIPEVR